MPVSVSPELVLFWGTFGQHVHGQHLPGCPSGLSTFSVLGPQGLVSAQSTINAGFMEVLVLSLLTSLPCFLLAAG